MSRKKWQEIDNARKILGLGERATLGEIKRAYYSLCKRHHPDAVGPDKDADEEIMYRLTEAYDLLMRYCEEFRFPLQPEETDIYDAEDWWMDRFGQDPLWSKGK
jgi:hypothetical protein